MRRACLAVAAMFCFVLAGLLIQPAGAQDSESLRNQVNQLRQQVRQLSNQVSALQSGGVSGDGAAVADGASGAELYSRLDEINESMRRINGRIEELEFKVNNLSSAVELVKRDADLGVANTDPGVPPASNGAEGSAGPAPEQARVEADPTAPRTLTPSGSKATDAGTSTADTGDTNGAYDSSQGPRSLGTLPLEPGEAPPPRAAANAEVKREPPPAPPTEPAAGEETAVASVTPATPKEQYDAAQKLLKNGQYAEAEAAFRSFIEANPKDGNVERASYWLGETLYARKNFTEASRIYARNVQQWPKGDKAPDNLVKLSLALINLKRAGEACQFLVVLDSDYPNAAQNVKQAAERAKKQAKCT